MWIGEGRSKAFPREELRELLKSRVFKIFLVVEADGANGGTKSNICHVPK